VVGIAKKRNVKPIQIALAWILQQPGITSPIIGAKNTDQLKELVIAIEIELTENELKNLEEPYKPKPISGHQ